MRFEIGKSIIIGLCALCVFLASCNRKLFNESDCLGKWEMLEDNSKSFTLKKGGSVEFHNLRFIDMGYWEDMPEARDNLSDIGTWQLKTRIIYKISARQILRLWAKRNGVGTYGMGGVLRQEGTELQLWIPVGDPDCYEWIRFRLVKPDP